MIVFLFWVALLSPFLTPALQLLLRAQRRRWADILAVDLMFWPGAALVSLLILLGATFDDRLTRITFWNSVLGASKALFVVFWFFTGIGLVVWTACEYKTRRNTPPDARPSNYPNILLMWRVPIFLALTAVPTLYLADYKTLRDAVEAGDLELTQKRLEFNLLGVDADTGFVTGDSGRGTYTEPILPLAAHTGNIDMAKLLLDNGASIDLPSLWWGGTPVQAAAREEHWTMVEFLVERGGNPGDGISEAAAANATDLLRVLLTHGADPNDGLHAAARANAMDALRMLLAHGADPHASRGRGRTLLDTAALGRADDAYELVSGYGVKLRDLNGFIRNSRLDLLERALADGADPNAEHPDVEPPLAYAARSAQPEFIEALMKAGARSSRSRTYDKNCAQTPLHLAVHCGRSGNVRALLQNGAQPDPRDERGRTPLHVATDRGSVGMINLLCEAGADVNAVVKLDDLYRRGTGTSLLIALEWSARRRDVSVVRALLAHGADPNLEDAGKAPIAVAVSNYYAESVPLLIEHGADVTFTSSYGESLIDLAASVECNRVRDKDERMDKTVAIAKLLVAQGADPWAQGQDGRTPLQRAERAGNTKLVEYLRSVQRESDGPSPTAP